MVTPDDDSPVESRPLVLEDLTRLCAELNRLGARYIVIGGMAVIQAGFGCATEDVDLLLAGDEPNVAAVRSALMILPNGAACELATTDLKRYTVVRVADEVVVDLLTRACGIDFEEAAPSVERVTIDGVRVPSATPSFC